LRELSEPSLDKICSEYLDCDTVDDDNTKNKALASFVIDNMTRDDDGRLVMPALWDTDVAHLLPNNYNLANSVLSGIQRKYLKCNEKLIMYDDVIRQQQSDGVLVSVEDIKSLQNNDSVSFIPHNAVFRADADTTKCRVVLLSNLCEKGANYLSHNQISLPGPDLNSKLFITCTLYRFNKLLLIYDLEKAFLQLGLRAEDCDRLHILWFKDVKNGDFSRVAMKFSRVPFGLRFSPALLMIALYVMLVLDCVDDDYDLSIREMMYNLAYMDNIAFSSSSETTLLDAYHRAESIFSTYCFHLQKFATNCPTLKSVLDASSSDDVKLFGMIWNTEDDTFRDKKPSLDPSAKTKRQILSTVNSNYDPIGLLLPILNRAKLFVRDLQANRDVTWDSTLPSDSLKLWAKICKQLNRATELSVPRYVGDYNSEYDLVVFTDASKDLYGCVIYLRDTSCDKLSFAWARNRTVGKSQRGKTIPVLELTALDFGVDCALEFYNELKNSFCPIVFRELHVYTDSSIALSWLATKTLKSGKIERKGGVINNCLDRIVDNCKIFPINFHHINGITNPADKVTRCISASVLSRSNYYVGPVLSNNVSEFDLSVPTFGSSGNVFTASVTVTEPAESVIPLTKFSSFPKLCRVLHLVRKFIYKLKYRISVIHDKVKPVCRYADTVKMIIRDSQRIDFGDIISYFNNPLKCTEPAIVSQLNLFLDRDNIIRVKNKFRNLNAPFSVKFPVLLAKDSPLTKCIILEFHAKYKHAGVYKLLSLLRREFHIINGFVTIKKLIKTCVVCRKLYGRPAKLNQGDYKNSRINPSQVPYRDIAIDHTSAFKVKSEDNVVKCYVLIVTCMFSRAVNLVYCRNIDNISFLMALQEHIFDYGMPRSIVSDNGSPIVSSVNIIQKYLMEDRDVKNYLTEHNIDVLDFSPYPADASHLGGVVESLVKQVKYMVYGTIARNILPVDQFRFLVKECNMLINKRPVALKASVRDSDVNCDSFALTPEMVVRGYEVPSLSVIPHLNEECSDSYSPYVRTSDKALFDVFSSLRRARKNLNSDYYEEFLSVLRDQGEGKQFNYKKRSNVPLTVGDYVAVRQDMTKPYFYQTGIVTNVETNSLDDVVAVSLRKSNREVIRRHNSDIILLLKAESGCKNDSTDDPVDSVSEIVSPQSGEVYEVSQCVRESGRRPMRRAAQECVTKNKLLFTEY